MLWSKATEILSKHFKEICKQLEKYFEIKKRWPWSRSTYRSNIYAVQKCLSLIHQKYILEQVMKKSQEYNNYTYVIYRLQTDVRPTKEKPANDKFKKYVDTKETQDINTDHKERIKSNHKHRTRNN